LAYIIVFGCKDTYFSPNIVCLIRKSLQKAENTLHN
jgi:hypothetical protein